MKIIWSLMASLLIGVSVRGEAPPDPAAAYVAPAGQLRKASGFTNNFSGVWDGPNAAHFGSSVYAFSCKPWRIHRIQMDPATATLSPQETLVLTNVQPLALVYTAARKLADGNGALYLFFSTHERPGETSLYWFHLDAKTGAASLAGRLPLPGKDHTRWTLAPDEKRLCAITEGGRLTTYRFDADGAPVEESYTNAAKGWDRSASGCFSPDGRQIYVAAGRIDTFQCEPLSGRLTFDATLALPKSGGVGIIGARPDGKYIYVSAPTATNQMLYVLKRDPATGALSLASGVGGFFGSPRLSELQFRPDGTEGFYFDDGRFTWFACDRESGAIAPGAKAAGWIHKRRHVELDRAHGNLVVLGVDGVDAFKLKGAW